MDPGGGRVPRHVRDAALQPRSPEAGRLPLPATRLAVGAVAHVAGSAVTFGGGASYRPGQRGTRQSGVILRYGG